ncbi:hypothetical protein LUZ60_007586 [Juncus effusus]|nr:hypothetical protein LUZ60_007586 [Juncus effusus]
MKYIPEETNSSSPSILSSFTVTKQNLCFPPISSLLQISPLSPLFHDCNKPKLDMKIQCDVCEKSPATLICCADEAALCASCDVEIHAANKLASKHQRLLLESLPNKLPKCDICQEKAAFIFCVEDRALFCRDCDENIHIPNTISGAHQRHLATGIRVSLEPISAINESFEPSPPKSSVSKVVVESSKVLQAPHVDSLFVPSWPVDEFLQLSDYESNDKYQKNSPLGFGELDWFSDIGVLQEPQIPTKGSLAEVPELRAQSNNHHNNNYYNNNNYNTNYGSPLFKPVKANTPFKKPRIEICSDDEEFFVVPDLG